MSHSFRTPTLRPFKYYQRTKTRIHAYYETIKTSNYNEWVNITQRNEFHPRSSHLPKLSRTFSSWRITFSLPSDTFKWLKSKSAPVTWLMNDNSLKNIFKYLSSFYNLPKCLERNFNFLSFNIQRIFFFIYVSPE